MTITRHDPTGSVHDDVDMTCLSMLFHFCFLKIIIVLFFFFFFLINPAPPKFSPLPPPAAFPISPFFSPWAAVTPPFPHKTRPRLRLGVTLHLRRQLADLGRMREPPVLVRHDADGQRHQR